ncbi:hypothetical protein PAXRUDRAFT_45880, partial [Paxillus rubicundulus Ve08.2h10]
MPPNNVHGHYLSLYVLYMAIQCLLLPKVTPEDAAQQLNLDISCILAIQQTCYLQSRSTVPKSNTLHLAWKYVQNEAHHHFTNMLHISPTFFEILLDLIQEHPIFYNHSNNSQTPVQTQHAVTLYHMGHYGNGASLEDVAQISGISEGSEFEKAWMDNQVDFWRLWHEAWVMYE